MSIDPTIFKAYDIRGTYPNQLSGEIAYKIGYALAGYLNPKTIAVGRDMRLSSDELFENLARGILDYGVDVIDLGKISTDGLYFAVGKFEYDGGVMITASHNPKQYNGFKICRKNAVPLSGQEGLGDILKAIQQADQNGKAPTRGNIIRRDIADDYAKHCLSFVDVSKIKPFKIALDAGNGMAGATLPPVLDQLPIETVRLFFDLDGSFPNHPASPIELENLVDLQKAIAENKADFGAAFDGDADRMFLVDKNGHQVGGDMVTALVAKSLLTKSPGEAILYNLICSKAVPELVERMGGTAIRTRVGHALIKPLMKKHNAIFGGEHSGHFYFRENWFADSGLIAFLVCLELLSVENRPLDEMIKEINPYFRSGEINSRVDSASEKIEQVSKAFPDGEQDRIDGLTVQYDDFWFNLRPSNTEPLLRLNVEANSKQLLDKKTKQLLDLIRS
ncbi:MAG: phosphomannomutase/phosphoglucomutase [Candidatus Zixiibacteriota bacterium]